MSDVRFAGAIMAPMGLAPRAALSILTVAAAWMLFAADVARAADAASLLAVLDRVIAQDTAAQAPDDYAAFYDALRDAYGVEDLAELQGRLHVALLTDVSASAKLRYFEFGGTRADHSAASTVKVALIAAVLRLLEIGSLTASTELGDASVEEHLKRIGMRSSNSSANELVHYIGIDNLNDWLQYVGFSADELEFGRYFRPGKYAPAEMEGENIASATGLAKLYFLLAQDEDVRGFLTKSSINAMKRLLNSSGDFNNHETYNNRLNGAFPPEAVFYHKTGENDEVMGDGGIVSYQGVRYIVVAFDTDKDRKAMQKLGVNLLAFVNGLRGADGSVP